MLSAYINRFNSFMLFAFSSKAYSPQLLADKPPQSLDGPVLVFGPGVGVAEPDAVVVPVLARKQRAGRKGDALFYGLLVEMPGIYLLW